MAFDGAIDDQGLRGFLRQVEAEAPDQILRIADPVSRELEMTSTIFELERMGRGPVVIYENIEGFSMPVVTNVTGSRDLLGIALKAPVAELQARFRDGVQRFIPAEVVAEAPWQEIVQEGEAVDLTALPVPIQFENDAGPYITAGQISARDPESGVDTTGFHRLQVKGRNRMGVSLHSRRRMYEFHRRAAERGENLPVAITIGIHPLHYMGSMAYHYPPSVRKYEIIGGLFEAPYRLARCGTVDVDVPAAAEIVIEGEILAEKKEPEGPFGEFTGYASYRSTQNVFVAKRLSMRRDAMFHSVVAGMSNDHILVSCVSREGEILNALRKNLPNALAVHVPRDTCGGFMAIVQMKKTAPGQPQMAIMAALGTELYTKIVVVVDEDVDPFDLKDVMWAVATRARADQDVVLVHNAMSAILDPTSDPSSYTLTKVGIDATKPIGQDFAERLYVTDAQRGRAREILAKAGITG